MSYFFNGRLWITPAVMSQVDDSAMFNPNPNVGNVVCLIGSATGGKPNSLLTFGSMAQAQAALVSGDLLDACRAAFDPSDDTDGPETVIAIRVNPAVQSTLTLQDSGAHNVIVLTSDDYGLRTNQIKVKVEAGSVSGLKLTTQLGSSFYTQDNVGRNAFTIQYTGGQSSATMSISNSTVTLQAPTGTPVASIALSTYSTVQQLVDFINSVAGFGATVVAGSANTPSLNGLDTITSQDVKTAVYTATANLQAVIDWYNSNAQGYVTAARAAGAGLPPAQIPFTYLSGGTDGSITNTQWSNAFTLLQGTDVQWVVPLSSDPSIMAMADAHVQFMSSVGRSERRAITGMALNTADTAAITEAAILNSDRTSLVHLGYYDYDVNSGALTLYQPYILAALIAGAFSGVNPGTPLTNKSIKVRGLERQLLDPTNTDTLINGGVLCARQDSDGTFRVVQSISTWLTNDNFNRVEVSCGVAVDFTARTVRDALKTIKGSKGLPQTIGLALEIAKTQLNALAQPDPVGPGVLAGDADNPAFKNLTGTLTGDVLAIQFQASPVIPINYVPITIFAQPFSGSASA